MTSRLILAAVVVAGLSACAAREKRSEIRAASAASAARGASATPDAGEDARAAPAESTPEGPSYGELMRDEAPMPDSEIQSDLRFQWLAPTRNLDVSSCREGAIAERLRCFCGLLCGLRFEERPGATIVSWPFRDVGGPGFEVAPDGRVRGCFYSIPESGPNMRIDC